MRIQNPMAWMLAEAVEQLQFADRLQRQFFRISEAGEGPCWEPPVDVYGDEAELGILVALPGVAPDRCEVALEPMAVVVRGERGFDTHLGRGAILQMEIPYGRFERRIGLPEGVYQMADMQLENGCLRLRLERLK